MDLFRKEAEKKALTMAKQKVVSSKVSIGYLLFEKTKYLLFFSETKTIPQQLIDFSFSQPGILYLSLPDLTFFMVENYTSMLFLVSTEMARTTKGNKA